MSVILIIDISFMTEAICDYVSVNTIVHPLSLGKRNETSVSNQIYFISASIMPCRHKHNTYRQIKQVIINSFVLLY